jgi:hypothetical protein
MIGGYKLNLTIEDWWIIFHQSCDPMSLIESVQRAMPEHYKLYNSELYFSNMLLTDYRLSDKTYKVILHVNNMFAMVVNYTVRPFLLKEMINIFYLIRFKILFENFRLNVLKIE